MKRNKSGVGSGNDPLGVNTLVMIYNLEKREEK